MPGPFEWMILIPLCLILFVLPIIIGVCVLVSLLYVRKDLKDIKQQLETDKKKL